MYCRIIAAAICLLAVLTPGLSQECNGTKIGDLPTHYHAVRGELYVENEYWFCIKNFSYDGRGPDAFLYFYYPGDTSPFDSTGGGVIINITTQTSGRPQFDVGTSITNKPWYRFQLPGYRFRACDFGGFSIWCRYANQLFTTLAWNYTDVFSTDGSNNKVMCTPSPGRGYAGNLPTQGGMVSGQLYIVSKKTMVIRNFYYNSSESDVFVYWYPPGTAPIATGGGNIIRVSTIGASATGAFPNNIWTGTSDLTITIPVSDDVYTCDIGTFTIWSRTSQNFFTMQQMNLELFSNNPLEVAYEPNRILCNRTTTRPGLYIGELPTDNPRQVSGTFYVVDQDTFFIQLFTFDTTEYVDVYLYYFPTGVAVNNAGTGGGKISLTSAMEKFGTGKGDSFYNQDLTVKLSLAKSAVKACDIGYFAILSEESEMVLTKMEIPSAIFYDSADKSRPGAVLCKASGKANGAQRFAMAYSLAGILVLLAYVFSL